MPETTETRGRGRPKDTAKRAAILAAAHRHFLQHGYARTSMDQVAAQASVSKLTIYSHFANKDALFQSVIGELADRMAIARAPKDLYALPPQEALAAVGRDILTLWANPDLQSLQRIMIAEAVQQPRPNRLMVEAGPEVTRRQIVELLRHIETQTAHPKGGYLQGVAPQGAYRFEDPYQAAGYFRALLRGDPYDSYLMHAHPRKNAKEIAAQAAGVAELFLRAYRA